MFLLDSAGSDHSHGSERAPQKVLRITQYPYIIGAEYSEPSSFGSEPDSLAQARTPVPEPSLDVARTPSSRRGSESPQESDWDSESSGIPYGEQGGSGSSVRSGSPSPSEDGNLNQVQQYHVDGLGRGPEPPSLPVPAQLSSPPKMFFIAVVSQSVYYHREGPDRSPCPCICISGTRSPCRSPSCSRSWPLVA